MKEFKVQICRQENDAYNEVYKVIGEEEYFARNTYYRRSNWSFVNDPLGLCELDMNCPDDYVFIICDPAGRELFRDSNGEVRHDFLPLKSRVNQVWKEIRAQYPTIEGVRNWLLSHLTPEILKNDLKRECCAYDNWTIFWMDTVKTEIIREFDHLGTPYCIYRLTQKHRYCNCEWYEYFAGRKGMEDWESYICYFGAFFDKTTYGPMYGNVEAITIVENALRDIYAPSQHQLSRIICRDGEDFEEKYKFREAAEFLVGKDFSRESVDALIQKERQEHTFYRTRKEILDKHPNYHPDFRLRY